MAEPKVQLVAPIGNISVPGMNVTGVVTASIISGNVGTIGIAQSIIQGNNIDIGAGIITATSFVGDQIGTYRAGSLTGSPDLVIGVVTASSYVGDVTGAATSIIQGTNTNAGTFNATTFVGNVTGNITGDVIGNATGVGASVKQGVNLNVGVATAVWYGDGSSLTGLAATGGYAAQNVTTGIGASGYETIIDLSYGNLIYYKGRANTTVGFASTSSAPEEIIFVRDTDPIVDYNVSYSTGRVQFDGTGDYLSLAASTDLQLDGDFTVECWVYPQYSGNSVRQTLLANNGNFTSETSSAILINNPSTAAQYGVVAIWDYDTSSGSAVAIQNSGTVGVNEWSHVAVVRSSNVIRIYVNGVLVSTPVTSSNTFNFGTGETWIGRVNVDGDYYTGIISNLRVVKGTAVYTNNFVPPTAALTNITNTKLLCCQSTSSTTAATVTPGTITANGDPTADSTTVSKSGTNSINATLTWPDRVRWDDGTTPTLISNTRSAAFQIFHLLSVDSGLTYNAWEEMKDNPTGGPYTLWAWGYNNYGQLAQNNLTSRSSPTQIPGTTWDQMPLEGSSGSGTSNSWISVKTDGTLWAWGHNEYGELGVNDVNDGYSSPAQIGADTTWSHSAGDDAFHLAIKTDGTLWSWGRNLAGELGLNQTASWPGSGDTQKSSPTQVGTDGNWSKVTTGYRFAMATKTDGTLWTWGGSSDGSLGLNDNTRRSSPCQVGSDSDWSDPIAGRDVQAAIKTDGSLYMWGRGYEGATGQNNRTDRSSPIQVGTDKTWNTLSIGTQPYVLAIKTDGTLWGWGNNWKGNLGLNSINPSSGISSPTQIPGTNWSQAGAAEFQSQATKTDGTLWTWGDNVNSGTYGSLGLNDLTQRSSPTQIPGTDWMEASGGAGFGMAFKLSS